MQGSLSVENLLRRSGWVNISRMGLRPLKYKEESECAFEVGINERSIFRENEISLRV